MTRARWVTSKRWGPSDSSTRRTYTGHPRHPHGQVRDPGRDRHGQIADALDPSRTRGLHPARGLEARPCVGPPRPPTRAVGRLADPAHPGSPPAGPAGPRPRGRVTDPVGTTTRSSRRTPAARSPSNRSRARGRDPTTNTAGLTGARAGPELAGSAQGDVRGWGGAEPGQRGPGQHAGQTQPGRRWPPGLDRGVRRAPPPTPRRCPGGARRPDLAERHGRPPAGHRLHPPDQTAGGDLHHRGHPASHQPGQRAGGRVPKP